MDVSRASHLPSQPTTEVADMIETDDRLVATLTPLGGMVNWILTSVTKRKWGHRAWLIRDIIGERGPLRTLVWFGRNLPRYEKTLAEWGPIRTHSMTTTLSMINGCPYCTHGHGLSLNLYYYRDHEELFPLSAKAMRQLSAENTNRDDAADHTVAVVQEALESADLDDVVSSLHDLTMVSESRTTETADEEKLLHLADMFAVLNGCGREACTMPDLAHSPINKDTELIARYNQARPGDVLMMSA